MTWVYGAQGKFTWRMLATVLGGESLAVFLGALVARGVGVSNDSPDAGRDLALMCGLGLLCIVGAGLMRRPFGLTLGWVIQLLVFVSAVLVPSMVVVGAIFLSLWILCLVQGRKADAISAQREADAHAAT